MHHNSSIESTRLGMSTESGVDKPNEPGLWTRDGKFYRVWNDRDDLVSDEIMPDGCLDNWSMVKNLPTGNWHKLTAETATAFSCPNCGGCHFGTADATATPLVRECHDQLKVGCRWKGEDSECIVSAALALQRLSSAIDERLKIGF